MKLGEFGVWQPFHSTTPEMAKRIEGFGFTTLWLGGPPPDLAGIADLLSATDDLVVGSSIVNIWQGDAATVAAACRRLDDEFPGRFVLGIGVGHREQTAGYASPMASLRAYLDALDESGLPRERRVIAALGPKTLELARERAGGSVPYLVTAEHTRRARAILGPQRLLAPEQKIVLESDPERARALARLRIKNPYLGLVNYTNNLRRMGFTEDDLSGDGSDRLIDELAIHGDAPAVVKGLRAHLDAGADHVQIQVIGSHSAPYPEVPGVYLQVYDEEVFEIYQRLAEALGLSPRP